jgi:trk system potassium uptake protein
LLAVLREQLKSRAQMPDDLCNILQLDLDEKAKLRRLRSQHEENLNVRLTQKRCALIKEEFDTFKGSARATKVLDALLKGLKFFARFNETDRRTAYEHAEYLHLPARTEIFREGDEGDRMYVILKGRVAVEKLQFGPRNLPVIVALLKDGEHFGELGLIDQEKIER